jgi:iron complex outermembrane recepter protein
MNIRGLLIKLIPRLSCLLWFLAFTTAEAAILEKVVVTAQKRTESLQEVAISVTAITSKTLEEMNIPEWKDLNIPGVYVDEAGDTRSQFIRGISTVLLERGFEMAVPLLITVCKRKLL